MLIWYTLHFQVICDAWNASKYLWGRSVKRYINARLKIQMIIKLKTDFAHNIDFTFKRWEIKYSPGKSIVWFIPGVMGNLSTFTSFGWL